MLAKQKIGRSFMGALNYNLQKLYHPDPSLKAQLLATNFLSFNKADIKKEVDLVKMMTPKLSRDTYHTSLNFSVDEKISNEKMLGVAEEYMKRMGFDNNLYCIFRHSDTSHPHCHILALRTRLDGTVVDDSNNYKRSEKIVRELEAKYDLIKAQDSSLVNLKAPDKDELEMIQRSGKASDKMLLQEKVRDSLSRSDSLSEFISSLEMLGVAVFFNQPSTGRVSGITYFMNDFKARGQALGNQFKWSSIIKQITYEQNKDSATISATNARTREKYPDDERRGRSKPGDAGGSIKVRDRELRGDDQKSEHRLREDEEKFRATSWNTRGESNEFAADQSHVEAFQIGNRSEGTAKEESGAYEGGVLHERSSAAGSSSWRSFGGFGIEISQDEDDALKRRRRKYR